MVDHLYLLFSFSWKWYRRCKRQNKSSCFGSADDRLVSLVPSSIFQLLYDASAYACGFCSICGPILERLHGLESYETILNDFNSQGSHRDLAWNQVHVYLNMFDTVYFKKDHEDRMKYGTRMNYFKIEKL